MKGEPRTMQDAPTYTDVVGEVREYLRGRIEVAERTGIDPARIVIDPGIGFGKDLGHNLELIRRIDALVELGRPVLVGPSRKRFIGAILDLPEDRRVEGTIGAVSWMVARGAHIVRVHDVLEVVRALRVVDAIAGSGE
jgi:dihydropteroate synthase